MDKTVKLLNDVRKLYWFKRNSSPDIHTVHLHIYDDGSGSLEMDDVELFDFYNDANFYESLLEWLLKEMTNDKTSIN